jgi:hypothetical protein
MVRPAESTLRPLPCGYPPPPPPTLSRTVLRTQTVLQTWTVLHFWGGRITTPRSAKKDWVTLLKQISRQDITGLALFKYHGGEKGVPELSLSYIHTCRYQSFSTIVADDVLPCYSSIQLLHKKVCQSWLKPPTLQSGPSVERILKQGLTVIPKLMDVSAMDTVAFYEHLQQVSAAYLIPMLPFDSICLANNYEGLFPLGLGAKAYAECSVAVLELLPRLLPSSDLEILATVSAVWNSSRNGYDLLWQVLALYIPWFDPTILIAQPVWTRDLSILDFSQSHLLYFFLQAKKNMYFTPRDRTNIFSLCNCPIGVRRHCEDPSDICWCIPPPRGR